MSLWEFGFSMQGFRKFHSSGSEDATSDAPSEEEFERWASAFGGERHSIKAAPEVSEEATADK